jgi:hypothetical protein
VFTIPWNAVHVAVESVFTIPWKTCSRSRGIRRSLQQPQPIPALRPIHAALGGEAALRGSALVAITDRLVDSVNTSDAILRQWLPEAA